MKVHSVKAHACTVKQGDVQKRFCVQIGPEDLLQQELHQRILGFSRIGTFTVPNHWRILYKSKGAYNDST